MTSPECGFLVLAFLLSSTWSTSKGISDDQQQQYESSGFITTERLQRLNKILDSISDEKLMQERCEAEGDHLPEHLYFRTDRFDTVRQKADLIATFLRLELKHVNDNLLHSILLSDNVVFGAGIVEDSSTTGGTSPGGSEGTPSTHISKGRFIIRDSNNNTRFVHIEDRYSSTKVPWLENSWRTTESHSGEAGKMEKQDVTRLENYIPIIISEVSKEDPDSLIKKDVLTSTTQSSFLPSIETRSSLGNWSLPYYSCKHKKWLVTYSVPISSKSNHKIRHNGSSPNLFLIDIDLSHLDINQCDIKMKNQSIDDVVPYSQLIAFAGTHNCDRLSSECAFQSGKGWIKGAYRCRCNAGFYSGAPESREVNATLPEIWKSFDALDSTYSLHYSCVKCSPGCDTCEDDRVCLSEYNWPFRISLLIISIICILLTLILMGYVYSYRKLKVIRVASPIFLCITLVGSVMMYCEMAAIFPVLDMYSCIATKWTRHLGFCVTYSALLLKTWRVSLTYRVKSAHKIKLTDKQLLHWLFPILLVMVIYLSTWTVSSPPQAYYITDSYGLKFKQCTYVWWDHSLGIGEFLFLLWGIRVCYNVRNAESLFNEAKHISYAIYSIAIVNCIMVAIHLLVFPGAPPDLKYLFGFIRTQLSTTVTIILVFGPKFYRVIKGQGDVYDSRARARGVTASFSLNGIGLVHEEATDLLQENEELKEEIQKLAAQIEFMKIVQMEMNNRHIKPKQGGYFTTNAVNTTAPPVGRALYMKFDSSDSPTSRISPAAELSSERV